MSDRQISASLFCRVPIAAVMSSLAAWADKTHFEPPGLVLRQKMAACCNTVTMSGCKVALAPAVRSACRTHGPNPLVESGVSLCGTSAASSAETARTRAGGTEENDEEEGEVEEEEEKEEEGGARDKATWTRRDSVSTSAPATYTSTAVINHYRHCTNEVRQRATDLISWPAF